MTPSRPEQLPDLSTVYAAVYKLPELKTLALTFGASALRNKKEIASSLESYTLSHLADLWARLDAQERDAIAEACPKPHPVLDEPTFRARHNRPLIPKQKLLGSHTTSALYLLAPGGEVPLILIPVIKDYIPKRPPATLVPLTMLPSVVMPRRAYVLRTGVGDDPHDEIRTRRFDREEAAATELGEIFKLLEEGKLSWNRRQNTPGVATRKRIDGVLVQGDFLGDASEALAIRSVAWPLLLAAEGRLVLWDGQSRLSPLGRQAMAAPRADVLRQIFEGWIRNTTFDEIHRLGELRFGTQARSYGIQPARTRREALVECLRELPIGEWFLAEDFVRSVLSRRNDLQITSHRQDVMLRDTWTYFVGPDPRPIANARFILCFLLEVAATLGLIDVLMAPPTGLWDDFSGIRDLSLSPYISVHEGLVAFRRTPFSESCIGSKGPAAKATRLDIDPSGLIKVKDPADAVVVKLLDAFSKKEDFRAWRLGPASILRGMRQGQPFGSLKELLERGLGNRMPSTFRKMLTEVQACGEKVWHAGNAHILVFSELETAQMIAKNPETQRYCFLARDNIVVVAEQDYEPFKDILMRLGLVVGNDPRPI